MIRFLIAAASCAAAVCLITCANVGADGVASSTESPAARAANQFSFYLLNRELRRNPDQDLSFSPSSIWSALTLASAGAAGETQKEMQATLHLPAVDPAFYHGAGALNAQLKVSKDIEFYSASHLWVQSHLHLEPPFLQIAQTDFQGGVAKADFRHSTPAAMLQINTWVSWQTHGKIPQLLQPGDINSDTRLVLANAAYFKGTWQDAFEVKDTHQAPFYPPTGAPSQVFMMSRHARLRYAKNLGLQVVRLPYLGGQSSMIIVLPRRGTPLSEASAGLSGAIFRTMLGNLRDQSLHLEVPRFTARQRLDLIPDLAALRMHHAFDTSADFSGMTRDEALHIGTVIHQSFAQVTEEGTEAAAATATGMLVVAAPAPEPPMANFTADHPFLYFIMDDTSGAILFAGAVQHPQ